MAVGAAVVRGSRAGPGAARASAVGWSGQPIVLQTYLLFDVSPYFLVGLAFNVDRLPYLCYTNASASAREGYFAWAEAEG